jgi:hypothetical protein
MKYVSKFQLGFSLHAKHLVPPGHDILVGLIASFLIIKLRL